MSGGTSTAKAATDIGEHFVQGGLPGLVIYALLLVILMSFVRELLVKWLDRRLQERHAAGIERLATAFEQNVTRLNDMNYRQARVEAHLGIHVPSAIDREPG